MYVLSMIFLIGGMYLMGLSFNLTSFQGPVFVLGILLVSAALATPMAVSAIEHRGDGAPH